MLVIPAQTLKTVLLSSTRPAFDISLTTGTLDSRINFSRASGASYYDATGTLQTANTNVPRIDYGPTPGGVTNRDPNSISLPYTPQPRYTSVVSTAIAPPFTGATVKLITDVVGSGDNNAGDNVSIPIVTNTSYTASIYVWIPSSFTGSAVGLAGLGDISNTYNNANMSLRNQWQRISVTYSFSSIIMTGWVFRPSTNLNDQLYWCMPQFEIGGTANTYVPTYGSIANSGAVPLGLLMEEQRTNSIRNSIAAGATAGTPGVAPTNWTINNGASGLSIQIVGTGYEMGIPFCDIRFFGTATGDYCRIWPEISVAASYGQTWTLSLYARLVNGSYTNIDGTNIGWMEAGATNVNDGINIGQVGTGALPTQRFQQTFTLSNTSVTSIQYIGFQLHFVAGSVDITIRIGAPQLEQGGFATSSIITSGVTTTRAADSATMSMLAIANAAQSGIAVEALWDRVPASGGHIVYNLDDGTNNNMFQLYNQIGQQSCYITCNAGGTSQLNGDLGSKTITNGLVFKHAATWSSSAVYSDAANGILGGTVARTATPAVLNTLCIGSYGGGNDLGAYIRRIRYWPRTLSSAELTEYCT